jgi:hypothetical protein
MKDKSKYIILGVLIAILLIVLAVVAVIIMQSTERNASEDEGRHQHETSAETETESEIEQQTQIVVSVGGQEDEKLYDALTVIANEQSSLYESAIADLQELSDNGNSDAQYILGEMYLQGIGTDADIDTAAEYIRLAYDNGNEKSFDIYGKLVFMGDGLAQDYEAAYNAFGSITDIPADINCALGIMYTYGMGVRVDYDKAAGYLDKAIADGSSTAQTVKSMISSLKYNRRDSEVDISLNPNNILRTDYSTSDVEGLDTLVEEVSETLKESESYTAFTDELSAMSKVNPTVVSSTALFGTDNWLFFQNESDGDSYNDYVGNNEFSDKELAAIKDNLEKQEKKANDAGSEFVLLIYPNKEIIYSDKMPSYIKRESETTRTDKLVEYLRNNTDLQIVYPKEEYLELKDDYQLYYATDTHCNMVGTYVSLSELFKLLYDKELTLDLSKFDIHSTEYSGDIGVMIGRQDRYSFDTVYYLGERGAALSDRMDSSLTLIGDSFSEFLNIEAGYFYKNGVSHYMVNDYSFDYNKAMEAALASSKSDVIVWECAERCIDRLK